MYNLFKQQKKLEQQPPQPQPVEEKNLSESSSDPNFLSILESSNELNFSINFLIERKMVYAAIEFKSPMKTEFMLSCEEKEQFDLLYKALGEKQPNISSAHNGKGTNYIILNKSFLTDIQELGAKVIVQQLKPLHMGM